MKIESSNITVQKISESKLSQTDFGNLQFGKYFTDHMFIADYDGEKWTDLRIVPFKDLAMHPANTMMHYGQSIFEGMKAYRDENGKLLVFRPEMNAKRFAKSAERLSMAPVPENLFLEALEAFLDIEREWAPSDEGGSLYLRPFQVAWDNFLGVRPSKTYRFMIIASPVGSYYSKPVNVKIETHFSRAAQGGVGSAKAAGNYAAALYPAAQAQAQGYDQLIWTDSVSHEFIEEAGTMNVMFIVDGKLYTSPLTSTILPGVTRDSVLRLAKDWGLEIVEERPRVDFIVESLRSGRLQEAFGVGTAATIAQIASIGYQDDKFTVPQPNEESFSTRVGKHLNDLKRGRIEDSYGWNRKY